MDPKVIKGRPIEIEEVCKTYSLNLPIELMGKIQVEATEQKTSRSRVASKILTDYFKNKD